MTTNNTAAAQLGGEAFAAAKAANAPILVVPPTTPPSMGRSSTFWSQRAGGITITESAFGAVQDDPLYTVNLTGVGATFVGVAQELKASCAMSLMDAVCIVTDVKSGDVFPVAESVSEGAARRIAAGLVAVGATVEIVPPLPTPRIEAFISDGSGNLYYHNLHTGEITAEIPDVGQIVAIGYGDPHGAGLFLPVGEVYCAPQARAEGDVRLQVCVWATPSDVARTIADDIAGCAGG
jgi:hypothetical protein